MTRGKDRQLRANGRSMVGVIDLDAVESRLHERTQQRRLSRHTRMRHRSNSSGDMNHVDDVARTWAAAGDKRRLTACEIAVERLLKRTDMPRLDHGASDGGAAD